MGFTRREFGALALGSAAGLAMSEAEAASFAGATDCHVHIIGPLAKYPMVPNRPYTPPEAVLEIFRREFDGAYEAGGLFQLTMHPHVITPRSRS
jgi:hypothetical protein